MAADAEDVTAGDTITVEAVSDGDLSYQWYECANAEKQGAVKLAGANTNTLTIPENAAEGEHFYFVRITVDGLAATDSDVITVNVI